MMLWSAADVNAGDSAEHEWQGDEHNVHEDV